VLDVGCGNGVYLAALRDCGHRGLVAGLDLSLGMLESARRATDGPLLHGNAEVLPFVDGAFDMVLAMHMLYHVPDRAAAIHELRRVLRAGGTALVVTNHAAHNAELDDLLSQSAREVGIDDLPLRASVAFDTDACRPELEAVFDSVAEHEFTGWLVVDEVGPVVAYARSMGAIVADTSGGRDEVIAGLARRVTDVIASDGAVRIRTAVGCFVCR
jgi:SAM-dependent methyltransferase